MSSRSFPEDFVWGVAAASYQIEGAVAEDGRGPSIWDTFSHTPGTIDNDDNGDVACDHYHRWPRGPRPDRRRSASRRTASRSRGRGSCPTAARSTRPGLDFYKRLVDGLLERGIRPLMTLYHWDLPQALDDGGEAGWLSRDLPDRFVDYALVLGKELGDRVPRGDHAQRAVVLGVPRLRDAASTPPAARRPRSPTARRTTSTSRTAAR